MSTIQEDISGLSKQAGDLLREQTRLKHLAEEFPDLKKHVGRWNKVAYYSKSVNPKVTRFDMRHNCGCCNDSPLEIWPHIQTEHGKIYSDPPCFTVGERHWGYGDIPHSGWRSRMEVAGIPDAILDRIEGLFRSEEDEEDPAVFHHENLLVTP